MALTFWSNKNDLQHEQNRRFLVVTAEWGRSVNDSRREQQAFSAAFSVPFFLSLLLFPSSVSHPGFCSLKQCCYSRCLAAYRTDKRNTLLKKMKIRQHADSIMAACVIQGALKLPPCLIEKKDKCVRVQA